MVMHGLILGKLSVAMIHFHQVRHLMILIQTTNVTNSIMTMTTMATWTPKTGHLSTQVSGSIPTATVSVTTLIGMTTGTGSPITTTNFRLMVRNGVISIGTASATTQIPMTMEMVGPIPWRVTVPRLVGKVIRTTPTSYQSTMRPTSV